MTLPLRKYDVALNPNYIAQLALPKIGNDNPSPLEKIVSLSPLPNNASSNVAYLPSAINLGNYFHDYQRQGYENSRINQLHDFTNKVPAKWVDILPESIMGGVLGFTYLGQGYMALRQDIQDDTSGEKLMVDVHESIHTDDEYETRILTDWILDRKPRDRYIR